MQKIQRLVAVGAMAALTLAVAACGSSEAPSTAAPSSAAAAPSSAATSNGVTQASDVFGPACAQVPTSGEGSVQGMIDDPVATAASNNPLLTTLVKAVGVADLGNTLNSAPSLTVLAPADPAFAKIPAATLDKVLADKALLTKILTTHVWDKRMDAAGLVAAGKFTALSKEVVTVGGTAAAPTFKAAGNDAAATTLCGNVPTANATVFVIDTVLMPGS